MAETITAAEAAKRLGISIRTLWRWCDAGKLAEAPRAGNYRMFYAGDVDALDRKRRGVSEARAVTLEEVYVRLADGEDVEGVKQDLAATICAGATGEGRFPLMAAYRAACSMAGTEPDGAEKEKWANLARKYGAWLGMTAEDVVGDIWRRAKTGSYCTYESARAELKDAPKDPAYAIAAAILAGK